MKKLFVLGMLLAMSTGCGRNWFSHLYRGAPCNGRCTTQAPMMQQGCENCSGAGYESYGGGDGYMGGDMIGSAPVGQTYESVPPMSQLPAGLPPGTIIGQPK